MNPVSKGMIIGFFAGGVLGFIGGGAYIKNKCTKDFEKDLADLRVEYAKKRVQDGNTFGTDEKEEVKDDKPSEGNSETRPDKFRKSNKADSIDYTKMHKKDSSKVSKTVEPESVKPKKEVSSKQPRFVQEKHYYDDDELPDFKRRILSYYAEDDKLVDDELDEILDVDETISLKIMQTIINDRMPIAYVCAPHSTTLYEISWCDSAWADVHAMRDAEGSE
ncbi:MAG: hypothetical protein HUJ62_05565 [Streptococcus gallolyticus]|nr:hypothetical protein [Streptococcus gallolyticus]